MLVSVLSKRDIDVIAINWKCNPVWRTAAVTAIAENIRKSYVWSQFPILADALEDAGCEDMEILIMLRSEPPNLTHLVVLSSICDTSYH